MKNLWMQNSTFWSAVYLGMISPASIYQVNAYSYPHDSEMNAMRGDWINIGADLRTAIDRGNVEARA